MSPFPLYNLYPFTVESLSNICLRNLTDFSAFEAVYMALKALSGGSQGMPSVVFKHVLMVEGQFNAHQMR